MRICSAVVPGPPNCRDSRVLMRFSRPSSLAWRLLTSSSIMPIVPVVEEFRSGFRVPLGKANATLGSERVRNGDGGQEQEQDRRSGEWLRSNFEEWAVNRTGEWFMWLCGLA